jgi:hypothetical protein
MTRRVLLIATTAILFGLQAPLCALACIDSSADASPASVADASEHPCHEESSDSPQPGAPSHEDCGCELAYEAVLPGAQDTGSTTPTWALAPPSMHSRVADIPRYVPLLVTKLTDLPPPDFLLLKSTLLI